MEELGFQKTIKGPKWDNVEHFVYYDRFYQLLISCLLEVFAEIIPEYYARSPELLRSTIRNNKAARYAFDFLVEFGLPWLRLRQAVRENNHTWIDLMWTYAVHWFRAAGIRGKTNYAAMCVYTTFVRHGMVPELAA